MFQVCRSCGCSNFAACAGGCWWVDDDLCSSCEVAVDVATGAPLADAEIPAGWFVTDGGVLVPDGAVAG